MLVRNAIFFVDKDLTGSLEPRQGT